MRSLAMLSWVLVLGCAQKPAGPALKAVEPRLFDAELGADLTLLTEGVVPLVRLDFDQPENSEVQPAVASAFIRAGDRRIDLQDVRWLDATRLTGRLVGPLPVGIYDLHLVEPRGSELVLAGAVEALDCSEGDCWAEDGGVPDSGVVPCDTLNYRDRDLDGFGEGAPRAVCGPGWVPNDGDCDNRDGLTFPGAIELCNGIDDDCDSMVDEGRCSDAGWEAVDELRGSTNDLVSVATFAPGRLWVTSGSKLFLRRGDIGFVIVSAACPSNMRGVWAEPGGEAEVGGTAAGRGLISEQSFDAGGCTNERPVADAPVAMIGFWDGGSAEYAAVLENGDLLRWRRGEVPTQFVGRLADSVEVNDLHGVSAARLFAVGSTRDGNGNGNTRPAAWSLQEDGGWAEEQLPLPGNQRGALRGVWALSPLSVIAVGDDGLILRRTAMGWRTLSSGTTADLTSVRAFTSGRYAVTTSDGQVRRHARGSWQTVFRNDAGVRFNDLGGTSEEDLWAVGDQGVIGRGPRPP
jgi:hypothetical protein